VLERDKEGQLDRTFEKLRRVTQSQVKRKKGIWIGHILWRNCLLKHFIEGTIEGRIVVTERQGTKVSSYGMAIKPRENPGN
jgi:hypothetical protein